MSHLKGYLGKYRLYILARDLKWLIQYSRKQFDLLKVCSLTSSHPLQGYVLFSYRQASQALLLKKDQPTPNIHTNYWGSLQMIQTFLDLGYCVDVINHANELFLPEKDYSIFVDVRHNIERLAPLLNEDCVKIMHIDTAHILFHNAAESRRLLELYERRGVTLRPRRFERPNLGIEYADCATTTGNAFTMSTFRYANKPIYRLPIPAAVSCPWPEGKDWEGCQKSFLWFNSYGLVHKGLDLVLDAFADMPEYHLTVCGPIDQEEDFVQAYHKELYQTPNIHTIGWVDVNSPRFTEIANNCIGIILLSCSECASSSVVNCMHAGLIPLLSYESGLDVDDFGFVLRDCSVENLKERIRTVAGLPTQELKDRARRAWEFARANHTRELFAEEYGKVITRIIAAYGHHSTLQRSPT